MTQAMYQQRFTRRLISFIFLCATAVVEAGPNLMAIGDYGSVPFKHAEGRISYSGREVVFSFDDPQFDFGRVVVRSSQPLSVVKRDLHVGFDGNSLRVDTSVGGNNVQIQELEVWLRIQGRVRPGFSYEWEMEGGSAQQIDGGFPGVIPLIWADGEPIGSEVTVATPEPEDSDRIQRMLLPHGLVKIKDFKQQTGAAWVVLKPRNYGNFFRISRFSFREVDSDPKSEAQSTMPVPVRYIEIRSELEDQIANALQHSTEVLKRQQHADGYWPGGTPEENIQVTADAVLILANQLPEDESWKKGIEWLSRQTPAANQPWGNGTVGSRLYCLSRKGGLGPYGSIIQKDVLTLTDAQNDDGGWGMRSPKEGATAVERQSDHRATLAALLALREARFAGAEPEKSAWKKALQYYTDGQLYDGGYNQKLPRYGGVGLPTTPGYTAIGTAGIVAALDMNAGFGTKRCNTYLASAEQIRAIQKGAEFLDKRFAPEDSFATDLDANLDPFLQPWAMKNLSMVSGMDRFRGKSSFEVGAKKILEQFDPATSMFGKRGANNAFAEPPSLKRTVWALSVLVEGAAPTICQRIIAGDDEKNHHQLRGDVAHLVRHIAAKRGRHFNWRRVSIDREVRELVQVPISILSFVGAANWTDEQWEKIRQYCFAGGTVVVDVADETQRPAVLAALAKEFPEYALGDVASDSPVFSAEKDTTPIAGLKSLSNGFRHFLFVPADSWGCAWHMNQPAESKASFAFMNSLLTYATDGTPPRSSFAASTYPVGSAPARTMKACRLQIGGAVPAYPELLGTVDRLMLANYRTGVQEVADPKDADLIWFNIAGEASDKDPARARLKDALSSGKYIFADVIAGKKVWDQHFRSLLQDLDPGLKLERLRGNDPLYTGEIAGTQGFEAVRVRFRKALQTRLATAGRCDLWGISKDGKQIGVYSTHDLSSGIGYHFFPDCRGILPEDSRALVMNTFLQAYSWKTIGKPQA